MSNRELYDQVFVKNLCVEKEALNDKLVYQSVTAWDSIGHMQIIAALEEQFGITMETDDIIDFSSYTKGMEILSTKYAVTF